MHEAAALVPTHGWWKHRVQFCPHREEDGLQVDSSLPTETPEGLPKSPQPARGKGPASQGAAGRGALFLERANAPQSPGGS